MGAFTGRPLTGKAPYGKACYEKPFTGRGGPPSYGKGALTGKSPYGEEPLRERRGGAHQNWGGISVDQKRPFLLETGPFLDLLPSRDFPPYGLALRADLPLLGALTGRPFPGKAHVLWEG